ncbi:MAG: class I SAM-dependent methyltransferase [Actinobacteria bacterium]|nr:class I SAM-dependent methyltransferase [Actinomycetota bacterium]
MTPVRADARALGWLVDGSVDAVLAEARALSMCLAAEVTVDELLRVLKPGGRLLLVVESLLLGLARLADQGRWAELADVPSADVVLVPDPSGAITRCFWPEELAGLLADVAMRSTGCDRARCCPRQPSSGRWPKAGPRRCARW